MKMVLVTLTVVQAALTFFPRPSFASENIEVSFQPGPDREPPKLLIQMTNKGVVPWVGFKGALPWVDGVSGAQLKAYELEPHGQSKSLLPLPQVGALFKNFDEIAVLPDAELAGEILLAQRFPDFLERIRKTSIVVVWTYTPFSSSLEQGRRQSGAVYFQKRGAAN